MAKNNSGFSNFSFCGDIVLPKKNGPWVKRETYKHDYISMNFGIKVGNNIGYVTANCFKNDEILTKNTNNENMNVRWVDRLDEDVVKEVASSRKFVVNLGERKEFIAAWDMIEYLETALEDFNKPILVTGKFVLRPGTGKNSDKVYREFQVQNVYAANENNEPHLTMNLDLYYDRSSMNRDTEKNEGKIIMDCYTPQWVNSDEGVKMFPIQTVFNTSVFDLTKEKHKKLYDYKMRYLETKSRNPVHMNWSIAVINGAEEVEFNINSLTDSQREQIDLGISTVESFRQRNGSIVGSRVNELRLIKPILKGEFADSKTAEPSDFTAREFEDEIYVSKSDETIDDMVNSGRNKSKSASKSDKIEIEDDDSLDTLF